jgi:hypothetical protein
MPTHDGLRPHDRYGIKNAWTATIEPNQQSAVGPAQIRSKWCALLEDVELVPQDHDFGLHPPLRLEAVAQHANEQEANCNHLAIMF